MRKESLLQMLSKGDLVFIKGYRKSLDDYMITREGKVYSRIYRKPISAKPGKDGDLRVILKNKDNTKSSIKVKRLLAYAFQNKGGKR